MVGEWQTVEDVNFTGVGRAPIRKPRNHQSYPAPYSSNIEHLSSMMSTVLYNSQTLRGNGSSNKGRKLLNVSTLGIVRSSLPTAWEVYTTHQAERHGKINTEESKTKQMIAQEIASHASQIIQCPESTQLTPPARDTPRKYLLLLIAAPIPARYL